MAIARPTKLDIANKAQHPMWNTIIKNSPWSLRHCSRLVGIKNNSISTYLSGNRTASGTRVQLMMSALLWNIAADDYHRHLHEMMWATYWAENIEDAPTTTIDDDDDDEGFHEWVTTLNSHPLYMDLPHDIAHDPAVNIYSESGTQRP